MMIVKYESYCMTCGTVMYCTVLLASTESSTSDEYAQCRSDPSLMLSVTRCILPPGRGTNHDS